MNVLINKKNNTKKDSKTITQNKKNGQSAVKKGYIEILKNTEINNITLNSVFYTKFKDNLKTFFIKMIEKKCEETTTKSLPVSYPIDNPFYISEKMNLKDMKSDKLSKYDKKII